MTPVLLAELAAKSIVVAGAALVLLAVINRRSAAERSWVAHAALVVLAALPAAVVLLPRWRLLPPVASAPTASTLAFKPAAEIDPAAWLQALYAGGAALLVLATVVAVLRLVALRRDAEVLVDPDWLTALARARTRMKVKSGAALLVSTALTSPVSWGLIRPTIVINEALVASKDDAEAVIAHELAHVARLDWAKLIGARLITALFWFNPLVWALARQCHQLREEAADDAVLGADVSSADYACLLVEAARREGRSGLIAAHGVAPSKGSLHRRVTRVLDAAARRAPTPAAWAFGVVIGAALLAGPLAALTLEPAEVAPATEVAVTAVKAVEPAPAIAAVEVKTVARPAAVSIVGAPRGKARPAAATVTTHRLTRAASAQPAATTVTVAAVRKANLTVAAPAPKPVVKPKVRVAQPRAEVASPPAPIVEPRATVTITGKGGAGASAGGSRTLTTNGKHGRLETTSPGEADRADHRVDDAERLADRHADEADRRADQVERRKDRADRRDDAREVQAKTLEATAAISADKARRAADVAARIAERDAASASLTRRKTAPPTP